MGDGLLARLLDAALHAASAVRSIERCFPFAALGAMQGATPGPSGMNRVGCGRQRSRTRRGAQTLSAQSPAAPRAAAVPPHTAQLLGLLFCGGEVGWQMAWRNDFLTRKQQHHHHHQQQSHTPSMQVMTSALRAGGIGLPPSANDAT